MANLGVLSPCTVLAGKPKPHSHSLREKKGSQGPIEGHLVGPIFAAGGHDAGLLFSYTANFLCYL